MESSSPELCYVSISFRSNGYVGLLVGCFTKVSGQAAGYAGSDLVCLLAERRVTWHTRWALVFNA
eukprot:1516115-Amphidinium_carterae.3